MAKIDKNANLYDSDGNLLKKAPITNSTIPEVEADLQKWTDLVKENPENQLYKVYLNNTYKTLFEMYRIYGNPHKDELLEKLKGELTNDQIESALNQLNEEITPKNETVMDEYVEFTEEPKNDA